MDKQTRPELKLLTFPKTADNMDSDADHVLEKAIGEYDSVLIIGWNKDGTLDPRASHNLNKPDVNWLIDEFKHKMLNGDY